MIVAAGVTVFVPFSPMAPKLLLTNKVAPTELQVKVIDSPRIMVVLLAVSATETLPLFTVTVCEAVFCPPAGPCTVMV